MKKEEILNLYNRYRIYIFPILVMAASLVLIVVVILPQTLRLISNNKIQTQLKIQFDNLDVKASTLEEINQEELDRNVNFTLSAFPDHKDFGNIIGILQNLISLNGFIILNFEISESGDSSVKIGDSYTVRVEVLGEREELSSLLNDIETSPRLMKIKNIDVTSGRASDTINSTIAINVFYQPLPKSVGAIDAPLPTLNEKDQEIIGKLEGNKLLPKIDEGLFIPQGKSNPFE